MYYNLMELAYVKECYNCGQRNVFELIESTLPLIYYCDVGTCNKNVFRC